jgi:hypothetical protein
MTDATNAMPFDAPAGAYAQPGVATGALGKPRGVLAIILLSIITIGIYGIYWQYKTYQEMKDHSGQGVGGAVGLLIGIFVGFISPFLMASEVGNLYMRAGQEKPVSGATGFWILLPLVGGIVWLVKTQGALNRYWRSLGAE